MYFLAVHILKYNNINKIHRLSAFLIWYIYVSTVIFSSSWRGLFDCCNGRNGILLIILYFKLTIQILRQSFLIGEKCGWGSKFGTTKYRTADISKIRNFEYWNNESRVIRFFYFRIYSLFSWLFKWFEHSKYIFDNLPSNSKVFEFW